MTGIRYSDLKALKILKPYIDKRMAKTTIRFISLL